MKTVSSLSALLLAGALAACGNGKDEPAPDAPPPPAESDVSAGEWQESIASLQALAGEAFSLEGQLEADLQPINEALPDLLSVSWDDKSLDPTSGATVFKGLKVTVATEPEFGLQAEEAELWGLDTEFVAARLRGERLDETGLAFNRLEARNVSYFGVANAFNTLFDAMEESIEDESGTDVDIGFETFDSQTAEMVLSNVSLRPYEMVPISDTFFEDLVPDEEISDEDREEMAVATEAVRLAQQAVAVVRTLSIESGASYDSEATFVMDQPGMKQSVDVSWEFSGYENMNGFDIGRVVMVNTRQAQAMEFTNDNGEFDELDLDDIKFDQLETTAYMAYEDFALDKLAGFLARAEFPGMDQRDLMSLGSWETRDYKLRFNDGEVFEVDRAEFKADQFAWFFPEAISLDMTGAQLDIQEVGEVVLAFIPEEAVEEMAEGDGETEESGAEMKESLRTAIAKLEETGLDTLPFDIAVNWRWGADTGETALSFDSRSEGFGTGAFSVDVTLPDYARAQAAFESEDKEAAFEAAFQEAFAFRGARFFESDDGGYDKLFAYASAIGKLYPQEGWGAMLGGMEPQQMRTFIATMIRSGKQPASQEFPPAAEWIESVAKYYETSGGSIELKSAPPAPVTVEYFDALDPDVAPEQFVEDLGLSVTHTPE